MALTEDDRFLIKRAREVAPSLRDGGVREQLAAQLLVQMADRLHRLGSGDDPELYEPPSGHHCKACGVDT